MLRIIGKFLNLGTKLNSSKVSLLVKGFDVRAKIALDSHKTHR